jgi:BlaI family transcriptional regulator, penicillinase repressor
MMNDERVARTQHDPLSKKERQAMDILFRLGEASASQVQEQMTDAPTYSAVRALLGVLVEKGHAQVSKAEGERHYLYAPKETAQKAGRGALKRLLATFFDDSPSTLVANLLDPKERKLKPAELEHLQALIDAHRQSPTSDRLP